MYKFFFKRLIDFLIAFVLLVATLPLTLPVWLLLMVVNGGQPFFTQPRPGKNGRVFKVIKFRTMNNKRDDKGELLPDAVRLTPVGRFVRKTSIDELPQMINVIKGDMSLIGPRPLLVDYLPLYNEVQARRHEARPGITGWAQVNGRNLISWEKKFEYDVWYVDHLSFALDMKIVFLTIVKIVKSEGISAENAATMERFKGSES